MWSTNKSSSPRRTNTEPASLRRPQRPDYQLYFPLTQDLFPNPQKALHFLSVENYGLRFGGVYSHSGRFTLDCESIQRQLEVTGRWSQWDHIICQKQKPNHEVTASTPSLPLEILSIKVMNRLAVKGQPWRSPTLTGIKSDLLLAMRTGLWHQS